MYFKMYVYVEGGEDFETRETLIDLPTFRQYQKMIAEGRTHLVLKDRVIKVSSIKEIMPADDVVKEYISSGLPYSELGLRSPEEIKELGKGGEEWGKLLSGM